MNSKSGRIFFRFSVLIALSAIIVSLPEWQLGFLLSLYPLVSFERIHGDDRARTEIQKSDNQCGPIPKPCLTERKVPQGKNFPVRAKWKKPKHSVPGGPRIERRGSQPN